MTAYVVADDYKATLPELAIKAEADAAKAAKAAVAVAVTPPVKPAVKAAVPEESSITGVTVIGLAIGLLLAPLLARKFKGMSAAEVVAYVLDLLRTSFDSLLKWLSTLMKMIPSKK